MSAVNHDLDHAPAATSNPARFCRHLEGKSASLCDKMIDRNAEAVIHFASSLKGDRAGDCPRRVHVLQRYPAMGNGGRLFPDPSKHGSTSASGFARSG